ncbi:MAG: hypothetical protein R3F14_29245 [Polyangiaceae bacterium]
MPMTPSTATTELFDLLRGGELSDRPVAVYRSLSAVVRAELDAETFGEVLRTLPADAFRSPYLADGSPEAAVLEVLLLAAASLGYRLHGPLAEAAEEVCALDDAPAWRLGHVVVRHGGGDQDAHVLPVLAAHLALDDSAAIRQHMADLAWDHRVAGLVAHESTSPADVARCLLSSPARHLARFPEALPDFGHPTQGSPADLSLERLVVAIKPPDTQQAAGHDAVPGRPPKPSRPAHADEPLALLRDLDTAPAAWRRSSALRRLLTGPRMGEVGGVELDLHKEAAVRIAVALGRQGRISHSPAEHGFLASDWLRFEVAALHHAAAIARRGGPEDTPSTVHTAWLIADWIGRVLRESPFLGADPGLLSARLESKLPARAPEDGDALWPGRMGIDTGSLRLDEVWLLHALFLALEHDWEPPGAVLDGLRILAGRDINDSERGAEEALEQGHDALRWPGPHLAPPLAARWLLHAVRAEWLSRLPDKAQQDTIEWLARWIEQGRPVRGTWIMLALFREGARLGPAGDEARALWIRTLCAVEASNVPLGNALGPFCLWGSLYVRSLTVEQAATLSHAARSTSPSWRVGVLSALAHEQNPPAIADDARSSLVSLIDSRTEPTLRLPAAVSALQLARKLPDAERDAFLQRVEQRLGPDLRAHPNVRVEMKRVGRAA